MTIPHRQPPSQLSDAGRQRRQAIKSGLLSSMARMHEHRRRRRTWTARLAAVLLSTGIVGGAVVVSAKRPADRVQIVQGEPQSLSEQVRPIPGDPAAHSSSARTRIELVATTHGLADQLAPHNVPMRHVVVDDLGLLALLNDLERPTGLVRTSAGAWLIRDVSDLPSATRRIEGPASF